MHLLALHVTPALPQGRAQVSAGPGRLGIDLRVGRSGPRRSGYTGKAASDAAAEHGIRLELVDLPEAKHGFVLLPRRWVVEQSFGQVSRFRRLARV